METLVQKRKVLEVAGEILTFSTFTIAGIPGDLVYSVQNYDSPYDIDKQEITFHVILEDITANSIVEGNTFTYVVGGKTITFEIITYTIDVNGWVRLSVKINGVA